MSREIITTDQAPQAIGTYSQAVKVGSTVYLSGQIPLVPETMELVDGDIEVQIRRVFDEVALECPLFFLLTPMHDPISARAIGSNFARCEPDVNSTSSGTAAPWIQPSNSSRSNKNAVPAPNDV